MKPHISYLPEGTLVRVYGPRDIRVRHNWVCQSFDDMHGHTGFGMTPEQAYASWLGEVCWCGNCWAKGRAA